MVIVDELQIPPRQLAVCFAKWRLGLINCIPLIVPFLTAFILYLLPRTQSFKQRHATSGSQTNMSDMEIGRQLYQKTVIGDDVSARLNQDC
ncbi:MAG: hypothetical protein JWR61_4597 [Ferruginibacter sp.]|nr:hypothetical protein [Ferruginibacter sp.]